MSIKTYAVKHKLSMFNVMKMVKSGKLETLIEEKDGKETTYIVIDITTEKEVKENIVPFEVKQNITLKEELALVKIEVKQLRDELEILKKRLH